MATMFYKFSRFSFRYSPSCANWHLHVLHQLAKKMTSNGLPLNIFGLIASAAHQLAGGKGGFHTVCELYVLTCVTYQDMAVQELTPARSS